MTFSDPGFSRMAFLIFGCLDESTKIKAELSYDAPILLFALLIQFRVGGGKPCSESDPGRQTDVANPRSGFMFMRLFERLLYRRLFDLLVHQFLCG